MENNKPQVRFKGFDEDWEKSKLGDVGEVKMCKRIFSNQTSTSEGIPFYKIGTFGKKPDAFISTELYQEFREKYSFPNKGDILISASGTIGRTVVYDGKPAYFQDSNIVWLNNDKSKVLNEFLYYIYENITYDSEGGTIQRLYNNIILNTKFVFPVDKTEQQKISTFFENLDKLISEHQLKHNKLKALKKAMLYKMFPQQGKTVPEIRFKGFTGDWEEKKLSELSTYSNGKGNESNQSSVGKYELINLNSISIDGGLKPSGKFVNHADSTLNENDIVMVLSDVGYGDLLGRVALIPENDKYVLNQRVALLRPNKDISPFFLFYNINANQQYFKLQGAGMSQLNLSKKSVEDFTSLIPKDIIEQEVIAKYLNNIDEILENNKLQIEKLQNIKKSFLAKMFI